MARYKKPSTVASAAAARAVDGAIRKAARNRDKYLLKAKALADQLKLEEARKMLVQAERWEDERKWLEKMRQ